MDNVGSDSRGTTEALAVERAVTERYTGASQKSEVALCCPVNYQSKYLEVLPAEILERDYGCGDPSRYVRQGDHVLDLGAGGGKICYIASQIVGSEGRVYGVDMNDDMLDLARRFQDSISEAIGWNNVHFRKGRIQDLGLDLDQFSQHLKSHPIVDSESWFAADEVARQMRRDTPMIASDSVDVVISNCVLNLVNPADRRQMFEEIFRVLKSGGRAAISDIVCDEPVPQSLQNDPELWSGCISGAFVEHEFLEAFEAAGFYGVEIVDRQLGPWAVVEGIEFRSMTVQAYKGKEGPCLERNQAVVYGGPWKAVVDDDGHTLRRGVRTAVCDKTFQLYQQSPYAGQCIPISPQEPVDLETAKGFDCSKFRVRAPQETKRTQQANEPLNLLPGDDCCGANCC